MTEQETRSQGKIRPAETQPGSLETGVATVRAQLKTLSSAPGVYRMLDHKGEVLYVGKAKNLKNRVRSYARPNGLTNRIMRMVAATRSMVFITTHTEAEALLLESNLIKKLKPRFNILLRDDKSFPYILIRDQQDWPQITKHRGARSKKGDYFGPFASAGAVNRTLNTLQRVFLLRSCSDSVLQNRTRPCLLYQIKRCSAPCVGKISADEYAAMVGDAKSFLGGRDVGIQKRLAGKMQQASDALEYETAAALRDRLKALTNIQSHQSINARHVGDADVMAIYREAGQTCIQVFFFRAGQNWGNRAYFPRHEKDEPLEKIMGAFLGQFYDNKPSPRHILVNVTPEARGLLEEAFGVRAERKVRITQPRRGEKRAIIEEALKNAEGALRRRLAESSSQARLLDGVAETFGLEARPRRIEVYDNSHISGSNPVGAMIVADAEGFRKNAYRKFNIKGNDFTPGDDYAMMRQVMSRRFSRLAREDPARERDGWPDLVLIDGGRGQLNVALETLADLGIEDVMLVGVSKGPDRDAGRERFHMPGRKSFSLREGDAVLYFLQRLRDEAHRFAIGSHRARRKRAIHLSPLDQVAGVGSHRKKALLHHFGSAKAVSAAGLRDLEAVSGISKTLAQIIYDHFHDAG